MRSRSLRRLPEERPEPVVSYSVIPTDADTPAAGEPTRVEPHFTVLPHVVRIERAPRFEEVAAPSAREGAEHLAVDDADVPRMDEPRDKRRSRGPRLLVAVGVLALLAGAGVLAATFGNVLHGGGNVTQVPAAESAALDASGDAAPEPGARVISPLDGQTTPPAQDAIPRGTDQPPAAAETQPTDAAAPAVIVEPPLPRTRPATADAAATTDAPSDAASEGNPDVDALMADVDRLLAERRAAEAAQGPAQQLSPELSPDMALDPTLEPDTGGVENALPGVEPLPPLPSRVLRRRALFPDPGVPVPPADIPNPTN